MTRENLKNKFLLGVLALGLLAPSWVQAITFDSIVVFGGSVSDSGNAFVLTGISNRPPYDRLDFLLIPDGPYSKGGNHFSNGATWIELYAKPRGLARSVLPAFRGSSPHATNYAVGGARSTDVAGTFDMPEQVGAFLSEHGNVASPDALYVIDFGGNDVRDALALLAMGDVAGAQQIIQGALASIAFHVNLLYAAGARLFLFVNVANIGSLPSIRILDSMLPQNVLAAATVLTIEFNIGLDIIINVLSLAPGAEVALLDVFQTVEALIADPQAFGLSNVTNACITPNVPPFTCKKENEYLFWDGIHPTKAVQAIFAQEAADVLGQ
ncbi:MAG TPA: SGNH/GDSL hydrolase family protein [Candidatus Binatia bacterium]|nr:SGNH/GDSL hydrolase family protein [Candidatus Binatia bacterium]